MRRILVAAIASGPAGVYLSNIVGDGFPDSTWYVALVGFAMLTLLVGAMFYPACMEALGGSGSRYVAVGVVVASVLLAHLVAWLGGTLTGSNIFLLGYPLLGLASWTYLRSGATLGS